MPKKKKHKWKYQINIKKKILVLIILGVFLFIGLGYAILGTDLSLSGILTFGSPHVTYTLDANGGTVSPTTINRTYGNTYGNISEPTKTGYSFLGWNGKNLVDVADVNGITVQTTLKNITLEAGDYTYSAMLKNNSTIPVSIGISSPGNLLPSNSILANETGKAQIAFTLVESKTVNLVVFGSETGYNVDVFNVQLEDGSIATEFEPYYINSNTKVTRSNNTTLKAMWQANTYTVSFNANGGSGGQTSDVTATYDSEMPAISATAPTRNGYNFLGWYDAQENGTKYYNIDGTSARTYNKPNDTTLYAHWAIEVGKYFTLVPDEATATTTTAGFSGSTSTSDQTLWRVININDNGTIEAVADSASSGEFTISGVNGYKNYVAGLQDIATKYAKAGYTVSTRMMGYDGQTAVISDTSPFDGTLNPTNNPDLSPPSTSSTPTPTSGTGEEYMGGVLGDTLYLRDLQLVKNVYDGSIDVSPTKKYLLASRYYDYYSNNNFGFYGVCSGCWDNYYSRYYNNSWHEYSSSYAVRPIITLRSGVTIASGTGTKTDPYILD